MIKATLSNPPSIKAEKASTMKGMAVAIRKNAVRMAKGKPFCKQVHLRGGFGEQTHGDRYQQQGTKDREGQNKGILEQGTQ
jgi:hypothetical protein